MEKNTVSEKTIWLFFLLLFLATIQVAAQPEGGMIIVPLGGNAFCNRVTDDESGITKEGIAKWTNKDDTYTVYLWVSQKGSLRLGMKGMVEEGVSKLRVTINKKSHDVVLSAHGDSLIEIGDWQMADSGYVAIQLKGISKTGNKFGTISNLIASGSCITDKTAFVKNDEGDFFYWGRRGPSVHLSYLMPDTTGAEWFYNEVTVPEKQDVVGSYFMADGFGEGYFGMQVNSDTERRVLFSVWSPYTTDDPASIPDSLKIKLVAKGKMVAAGEFGSEGSGGQSYLQYNWKAGNTYRFLLHGLPGTDGTTTYTAYFYAPEVKQWQLIASFRRPQTHSYLTHLHSFLENFIPAQGNKERRVLFNNEWMCDGTGTWTELTKARFTVDNTGKQGYRLDYGGGLQPGGGFYLQNCGFFSWHTTPLLVFKRKAAGKKPKIDFGELPRE